MEKRIIIDGFETDYYATEEGEIISYVDGNNQFKGRRILKPILRREYYAVNIYIHKGKGKFFCVHRLVYAAFNGVIPDKMQVDHKNCIKTDNKLSNLRCISSADNTIVYHKEQKQGDKFRIEICQYGIYQTTVLTYKQAKEYCHFNSKSIIWYLIKSGNTHYTGYSCKKIHIL